jgi:predicted nucleic acid-binding protein
MADLLIAASASAVGLPLYTRNSNDVDHLAGIVEIVTVH